MVSVNRGNFSVVLQKYIQREIVKLKLKFLISKILLNLYMIFDFIIISLFFKLGLKNVWFMKNEIYETN